MSNEIHELFAVISDEEKAGVSAHLRDRIDAIVGLNDGPIRARLFAAATMVAGAELFAELHSKDEVAVQLRRLAESFDTSHIPRQ